MDLDLFSLKSIHGGQNWGGSRSAQCTRFLLIAGEEVQFSCTDVTLFAHG